MQTPFKPPVDPHAAAQHPVVPRLWQWLDPSPSLAYGDADAVEQRLLDQMAARSRDNDPDRADPGVADEALIQDWPSQYHLDPARQNLLLPIAHLIRGRVLEIGAGCGALTGFLCRQAETVLALEGAPRRACITASRHASHANLAVLAAEFDQVRWTATFDTIVVVGVLEYTPRFTPGGPAAFLALVRRLLAPDGVVILAIENQLGLSFLGGMPEDHAGQPWFGVEDRYGPAGFRTFGRHALAALLDQAGLPALSWLYPFPDYKLPQLILAHDALRQPALDLAELAAQVTPDRRFRPGRPGFEPALAWNVVVQNGLLPDLADSFLVVAATGPATPPLRGGLAWIFANRRLPQFRKLTRIGLLGPDLLIDRLQLHPNHPAPPGPVTQRLEQESFQPGTLYLAPLRQACAIGRPSPADIAAWAADWLAHLRAHLDADGRLPADYIDCIPANLIRTPDATLRFFDREWRTDPPPTLDHVVFRGLWDAATRMTGILPPETTGASLRDSVAATMQLLGFAADLEPLCRLEATFQAAVTGAEAEQIRQAMATSRRHSSPRAPTTIQTGDETTFPSSCLHALFGTRAGPAGYIDGISTEPSGRYLFGWAWDPERQSPADLVVLLLHNKPIGTGPLCIARPDVPCAKSHPSDQFGFKLAIPAACGPITRQTASVVAWSDGRMGVLQWTDAAISD